jgi:prepilin-type processing-associated H-X9-DG protein
MYAGDNGGYLPPFTTSIDVMVMTPEPSPLRKVDRAAGLIGALAPYSRSAEIWFCPADPFARRIERAPPCLYCLRDYEVNHRLTSYFTSEWWYGATGLNDRLFRPVLGQTPLDISWRSVSTGGEVSDTLLMHDMLDDLCAPEAWPDRPAAYSHTGRFNFLYFDGHLHFGCYQAAAPTRP